MGDVVESGVGMEEKEQGWEGQGWKMKSPRKFASSPRHNTNRPIIMS